MPQIINWPEYPIATAQVSWDSGWKFNVSFGNATSIDVLAAPAGSQVRITVFMLADANRPGHLATFELRVATLKRDSAQNWI